VAAQQPIRLASTNAGATEDSARGVIDVALDALGTPPEQASLEIGMPRGFLRAYLTTGMPRTLSARLRRRLARYLGVPEQALR
jgi:hypothetical protein